MAKGPARFVPIDVLRGFVWSAWVFGLAIVAILYALCAWYRRKKAAHPRSILQYV